MPTECSQEAILNFLREHGDRVKNSDLVEHFKDVFPPEPEPRAAVREAFKSYVDKVAFVKTEDGVKYVCLKRRFRADPETAPAFCSQVSADDTLPPPTPGSCYGNDSQLRVPHTSPTRNSEEDERERHEFACAVEGRGSVGMGNRGSVRRERSRRSPAIPEITVVGASPLPSDATQFSLPGPAATSARASAAGLAPRERQAETEPRNRIELPSIVRIPADSDDDEQVDSNSDGSTTPSGSRKHFIQLMMNTSPQVRRSMVFRNSVYLPSRSDSDSASLLDDDRTSVTLDPLEHEWMMCSSDGEWSNLYRLLATEPGLLLRKDFVTGFNCLHWAAKHGRTELIALIINFAKQSNIPIDVDARSSCGYTPLHLAAMQNHLDVVKLLVGAYNADVEVRDYSGRKACQYLTGSVSMDIRDIVGEEARCEEVQQKPGNKWRFSKVLQSNLKPPSLHVPSECDTADGSASSREKPLRRKSSFSMMKPKLERLQVRTSQIVHSTSFRDADETERPRRGSFRLRAKSHFFGS
ncbi:ankyrin repeat domain-containing protein SOWAHC-like [Synchiropus splendidus]|uniref:ankyrin repeat domain-containing protein SOWAHC-like n=1 Tax=Synchiropus splendidus TaxID=270530 RepID=UPI00237E7979|nr:ankyrin repeat domain-containing protein SOWAHC-like [Synchiropus splendidus]